MKRAASKSLASPVPNSYRQGRTNENATTNQLIGWDDLLPWQRDNEFILTHYRQASFSWRRSLQSIRRLHNETVNIWTHGLGAMFYGYFLLQSTISRGSASDIAALCVYYTSVVICFVLSSSFHTFLNHSPGIWHVCSQLDHLGIVLVIWGSSVASTYFGFYCDIHTRNTYWAISTIAAAASAWATFQPVFRTPTGRKIRVLLYCSLGLSAFIPAAHGILEHGWEAQNERQSLAYFLGLGILNFTGTAIYGARVPERWFPRMFDVYGASHQIMHVLVMCGAYSHGVGLSKALEYWILTRDADPLCVTK